MSNASNNQVQQVICEEFTNVLGLDVDPEDSFLELGGYSLLATKAASRINQRLDSKITVGDVFEYPVVVDLAEKVDQSERSNPYTAIPRTDNGSNSFLQSFAQGRLWFMDRLYPQSTLFLMPFATRFRGPLDLNALNKAISGLEERHETLRTTFELQDGVGVQVVHPFQKTEVKLIDLTKQSNHPFHVVKEEQTKPFNLETDKAWRVTLFKLGDEDHILSIVLHHIVCDGWSIDLMRQELRTFYSAALHGKQEVLSKMGPLPVQYRDFSVWQRQPNQEAEHEKQLQYWRKQLDGSQPAQLLCDKPRPPVFSGRAEEVEIKFDDGLYQALQAFCKDYSATPFAVLLAAFRATHFRLTGAEDATIGTPIANRNRQELEGLVGFFTNVQCLRLRVQKESFASLVEQTKSTTYAAFANQDVSFEKVVSALQPDGSNDASRHPLVQLMFALHDQQNLGEFTLENATSERMKLSKISRLDFEFHVYKGEDGLNATVHYATDLYDPQTIQNIISNFFDVLAAGFKQPETPVASLPLRGAVPSLRDMDRLEIEQTQYPRDSSLVDCFLEQVKIHPDRVAVKDPSTQLTYSQLNEKSDMVARWLLSKECPPESLIGVFAPRSCETIAAFYGILKASLAYVPFDLKTPASRLDTIYSDFTGRKFLLLGSDVPPPALQVDDVTCISISQVLKEQAQAEQADPHFMAATLPKPTATSLAYVMFTSGSTGKPKGVMVEHRPVVRMMKSTDITVSKSYPDGAVAHMTGLAFDVSGWEIYHALLNGGTLVCIDIMTVLDGPALHSIFKEDNVRVVITSPAVLKQVVQDNPATMTDVQDVYVIGDVLRATDALKVQELIKGDIFNSYGPTENGITSTQYCVPRGFKSDQFVQGLPIGHSIPTSGAYVMDDEQRLVPVGIIGELVVTGDGLARGYTDSALDVNRFVEVNIDGKSVRAYRTGDAARYNATSGELDFFGRLDYQVKIRGHRIELPEIENVLNEHQSVRDAVVLLRQNGENKDPDLVSFVSMQDDGGNIDNEESAKVQAWGDLWEVGAYTDLKDIDPKTLGRDFAGWTSGYDGSIIDPKEMQKWLDETIATIHNTAGGTLGNVFEVGSGSGMILFNLAVEKLKSYFGIDLSPRAIEFVSTAAKAIPGLAEKIQVQTGAATDIDKLHDKMNTPNLIVINSVIQYFPSSQYLLQAIEDLLQIPSAETIFIGDVRSYALFPQFLASKALRQLGDSATQEEYERKIETLRDSEEELLVDPGFFTALTEKFSDVVHHVEILPKRLECTNELSCYRYAVILHLKRGNDSPQRRVQEINDDVWVDFVKAELNREALVDLLRERSAGQEDVNPIAISNIPDSKTILERHMVDSINEQTDVTADSSGSWLSGLRPRTEATPSLSPIELKDLAESVGMQVDLSWARQYSQRGGIDAIFHKSSAATNTNDKVWFKFPVDHAGRQWQSLTSRPLRKQEDQKLVNALRDTVQAKLPPYMMPTVIRILDKMPLNPSGKVDRIALKKKLDEGLEANTIETSASEKLLPRTELEKDIRRLWAELLGISEDDISINDHFFRLGGNSLRTVSLAKVIQQTHGVNVGLGLLNSKQATVSGIATAVEELKSEDVNDDVALGPKVDLVEEVDELWNNMKLPNSSEMKELDSQRGPLKEGAHVFLTGATGYLGSYILKQLVQHSAIDKVTVLVRARDASHGLARLKEAGRILKWWHEDYERKIQVWIGDLAAERFNLPEDQWQILNNDIHAIVHNGAHVDFVADYATLKTCNVDSTAQLLQVSLHSPAHPRLVFVSGGPKYLLSSWQDYVEKMSRDIGYSQAKVVSELLIHKCATHLNDLSSAAQNDTLLSTVKPGYIIGTPSEGVANTDDFLWRMVAGAAGLDAYPAESSSRWMYIADGDAIAKTICDQLTLPSPKELVEINSGVNPVDFWEIVMSELHKNNGEKDDAGKTVQWDEWVDRMQSDLDRVGEQHPLWPVQHILGKVSQPGKITFEDEKVDVDGGSVQGGVEWKKERVDAAIRSNVRYLTELGFVPTQAGDHSYDARKKEKDGMNGVFTRSKKELEYT